VPLFARKKQKKSLDGKRQNSTKFDKTTREFRKCAMPRETGYLGYFIDGAVYLV